MTVFETINNAKRQISIRCVIIRNPNITKVLYIGEVENIPARFLTYEAKAYLYNPSKERLIIKI